MNARTILLRLLFVVVLLFLLLAVFHTVENWRGERAWQDYVTAARARGAKLYATEFQAPPIPPEQNYAAIPVFEEAFAASEAGLPPPESLAFPKKGTAPAGASAAKGECTNLEAWREYLLDGAPLDAARKTVAADVLEALEKYEPVIQQLRDAGERPASRFPVKWERGFATPVPHSGLVNKIGQILSLRMSAHLARGDSAAAYAEFQHGLRFYRGLREEPTLFSGLLRLRVLSGLLQSLWEGLAEQRWTDVELNALAADLSALRLLDDLRFSWDSERSSLNTQMEMLVRMSRSEWYRRFVGSPSGSAPGRTEANAALFTLGYPRGWLRRNQLLMNDIHDVALDRFSQIERGGRASAPTDTRTQALSKASRPRQWYYTFTLLIMPSLAGAESRFFAVEARVQQAIAACGLESHWIDHGTYPSKLEELVPEYLRNVPRDLMGNIPMRYRQTLEGRYEIWAVGSNGVDDDARLNFKESAHEQPDWVWHYRNPSETKPRKAAHP